MKRFRAELIAGVLAFLVALCFVPQVLHFSHRNDAEREVWNILPLWHLLETFEYRLYDLRFTNRGIEPPKSLDKIVIVGIDDNTMRTGSWPMQRSRYARVVNRLSAAGARVIALDVDFSQHQTPREDALLEKAMEDAGNVLLASYLTPERVNKSGGEDVGVLLRTTTPIERFDDWAPDLSLIYVPVDADGRVRRYPLYAILSGSTVGSMAALSAAQYQGILDGNENKRYENLLRAHRWPSLNKKENAVPVFASRPTRGESEAPLIYSTPINFWGPPGTIETVSFSDVEWASQGEYSAEGLKKKFSGKIVFVGATSPILHDTFDAPEFKDNSQDSRAVIQKQIPGVEIHATATAMLLDGVFIRSMSTPQMIWLLFGLTLFCSLWAILLRNPVSRAARGAQVLWTQFNLPGQAHTSVWFGLYLLLSGLPIFLFWQAANYAFQQYQLWIVVAYPALSASFATACVLLLLFSVESGERRKIERYFTRLVSPELKAKMLASGKDYLEAEKVCVSVLFSDLEGFTTYSETHPPEEVIQITNDFLSSVVPIIYRHGGWVDKYIGDAVMAVFGTPVEYSDHAERALRVAIEMQDAAIEWRRRTGIGFYMRVGIHTGEVIAGNMGSYASAGSPDRMDYTVIGDTVNLASRLEGKNKEFGSWIMCSAATFEAAPDLVAAEAVSAPIKGKSQAVEVYIVRGLKDDPERDKNWAKDAL